MNEAVEVAKYYNGVFVTRRGTEVEEASDYFYRDDYDNPIPMEPYYRWLKRYGYDIQKDFVGSESRLEPSTFFTKPPPTKFF